MSNIALLNTFFIKKESIEQKIVLKISRKMIYGWEQKKIFPLPENHDRNIKDKFELGNGWPSIIGMAIDKVNAENIHIVKDNKGTYMSPYDVSEIMNKLKTLCNQFQTTETKIDAVDKIAVSI